MNAFLRCQAGASLIEFAVTLPLLVVVMLGAFEVGSFMSAKSSAGRAASDIAHMASQAAPGRADASLTPANADFEFLPGLVRYEIGGLIDDANGAWAVEAQELLLVNGAPVPRATFASDGDQSRCALPEIPSLDDIGARHGERFAVVRLCVAWDGPITGHMMGNRNIRETRVLPMHTGTAHSCQELFDLGQRADGIYTIDPDESPSTPPLEVKCDMDDFGGWTLVAAQFGANPVSWSEGVTPDYDPTLISGASFSLAGSEIPTAINATRFSGMDGTSLIYSLDLPSFVYSSGDIKTGDEEAISTTVGEDTYQIYRSSTDYFDDPATIGAPPELDPEVTTKASDLPEFRDCLIVDKVTGTTSPGQEWWFCPNPGPASGVALGGNSPSAANVWMIWVR